MAPQNYHLAGHGAKEIAASAEDAIARGALGPGDRLPTVRQLAADLGVSTATVADAYRQLRERGLLTGAGRGGTIVRAARPRSWRRAAPALNPAVRDLAGGNPDPALLPDLRPALATAAADLVDGRSRLYGQAEDNPDLVRAFAAGFAADGITADHVAIVGGALDGIGRVLAAHLHPGERVAVEDPCYCGLLDLLDAADLQPVPVPIDRHGILPDQLADVLDQVQAVVLTPRLHSPTGAAITPTRLDALQAVLASRPDLLVIDDDHSALIADAPLHSLAQNTDRSRWATVRSVSKALGPDLRLGSVASDPLTHRRITQTQQAAAGWVSHLLQAITLAVLTDPDLPALLHLARTAYTQRRNALLEALAQQGITLHADSGLNVWLPTDDETTTAQALLTHGWAVRSGTAYRLNSRPALRITTASLQPDEASQLARHVARAVRHDSRTA